MDFELRAATAKWEREQKEKKERARARLERERKAREEAAKRQEAIEAAQRIRRLEESAASLAATQREQEDLEAGDGIIFNRILQVVAIPGDGDKIRLPASAFEELSSQSAIDKGPMFFEVSAVPQQGRTSSAALAPVYMDAEQEDSEKSDRNFTHAGVLEFTTKEGFAELPPHVWRNAGFADLEKLLVPAQEELRRARVRYVRLPKGTYAKLQPEGGDFADVPNHKAVLETKLRQHASLSEGDLLIVQHGGVEYGLRVLELRPQNHVSVLETDLEVDVVGPAEKGLSPQNRLTPLFIGKPEAGTVQEGQYAYFRFTIDPQSEKAISAGDLEILVHLDVQNEGDVDSDADLYVAAHPLLFPAQHQHQWSSHDMGSKVICMTASDDSTKALTAGRYSVGVYGFRGVSKFRLWVEGKAAETKAIQGQRLGTNAGDKVASVGTSSKQPGDEFGKCENCKQLVPVRTLVLHEAYCRRHNYACQHSGCGVVLRKGDMEKHAHCTKCGQGFTREELDKHMKVFHEPLKCECGVVLEMEEMVKHRATTCPRRMITCRFCGDMWPAGAAADDARDKLRGLNQHESSCGARTAECDTCGRVIMLKEMDIHRAAAHEGGQASYASGSLVSSQALFAETSLQSSSYAAPDPPRTAGSRAESLGADQAASQVASLAVDTLVTEAVNGVPKQPSIECPICALVFEGADRERQLNVHLDDEHFTSQASTGMDIDNVPSSPAIAPSQPETTTRKTLTVSCPICGMAVHSERDLSSHIDMVH